jgi:hypothetical protein
VFARPAAGGAGDKIVLGSRAQRRQDPIPWDLLHQTLAISYSLPNNKKIHMTNHLYFLFWKLTIDF